VEPPLPLLAPVLVQPPVQAANARQQVRSEAKGILIFIDQVGGGGVSERFTMRFFEVLASPSRCSASEQ
jgi:hypothetical protein